MAFGLAVSDDWLIWNLAIRWTTHREWLLESHSKTAMWQTHSVQTSESNNLRWTGKKLKNLVIAFIIRSRRRIFVEISQRGQSGWRSAELAAEILLDNLNWQNLKKSKESDQISAYLNKFRSNSDLFKTWSSKILLRDSVIAENHRWK